ncbi:MAG: thioredoxin fold domain-containing protein [Balneolaceae bacterium]
MNSFFQVSIISLSILLISVITGCEQEQQQQEQQEATITEIPGEWYSLEEAQILAAEDGKKILIYAEAVWCPYCKRMKSEVFTLDEVQQVTQAHFYPVKIDIESEDSLAFRGQEMTEMEFSQGMQVTGTPTFIFFDHDGEIIAAQPGFIPADMYTEILRYVGTDAYLEQSFEEFAEIDTTGF